MDENALSGLPVRPAHEEDEAAVVALWQACGLVAGGNDPHADFRFARAGAASEVLVAESEDGRVVGSVMVGHDGHRGWLYYVAADPGTRPRGIGRAVVRAAEAWLRGRRVRRALLLVQRNNAEVAGFYEHLGFEPAAVTVIGRWLDQG